ncbi:MAG TPA: hypothetical protein PLB97_02500, partial [Accumulibacter sp.]|nr:hypothetical protein [Accumulibacter sp.]
MTDFTTTLNNARTTLAELKASATALAVGGAAQAQAADAGWKAIAAIEAAQAQAEGLRNQIEARNGSRVELLNGSV